MNEHAVVIAGGGPTGMMLAAELALAKIDVAVVERRPDQVLVGSRAGTGVDVELSDGAALRAQYLVGCDGGRSMVRKGAGIEFPGWDPTRSNLIAGDAAHVHYPAGGQGLSLGVQDAVNLGWKLAQVVDGTSPESLLDTYHAERHPVAARALRYTMAQTALQRRDDRMEALVDVVAELARMDEPRKRLAGIISGLDIRYDLGDGHPLLGRRMPDLDLVTADGPLRVFELLHGVRPVLLNLGEPDSFDIAPWADRVRLLDAEYDGPWEASGRWRGHRSDGRVDPARRLRRLGRSTRRPGLRDALTGWRGPRSASVP